MRSIIHILGILCLAGLYSCGSAPPGYITNKMHIPLFTKQGQVYAEGAVNGLGTNDLTAGVSVLPNLFVLGTMNMRSPTPYDSSSNTTNYHSKYYEINVGYFWSIVRREHARSIFELVGSFGKGSIISEGFNTNDPNNMLPAVPGFNLYGSGYGIDTFMHVDAQYNRYSIEMHVGGSLTSQKTGFASNFGMEGALCLRLSLLYFTHLEQHRDFYVYDPNDPNAQIPSITTNWKSYEIFPELGLMLRFNFSAIAIEGQCGMTFAGNDAFDTPTFFTAAGVFLRL